MASNKDNENIEKLESEKEKLLKKANSLSISKSSELNIQFSDKYIYIIINDEFLKIPINQEDKIIKLINDLLDNLLFKYGLVIYYEPELNYLSIRIGKIEITIRKNNIDELYKGLIDNPIFNETSIFSSNKKYKKIKKQEPKYYLSPDEVLDIFYATILKNIEKEYEKTKNYSDKDIENYMLNKHFK